MTELEVVVDSHPGSKYHKVTVAGQRVCSFTSGGRRIATVRTVRRYAVVVVRPEPFVTDAGQTYVAFAECDSTTDNLAKAKKAAAAHNNGPGALTVVVDLTEGVVL